jgi:hypothetical protein
MKSRILLGAVASLIAWVCIAQAQETQNPTPSHSPTASNEPLVLKVSYNPALRPAYITVAGVDTRPHWVWVTRFVRTRVAQVGSDLPIRAVRFEAQFNGETADIRITLLRGVRAFDREDPVGVYHLGINERKVIGSLRDFGIEPIEISLVSGNTSTPPTPAVVNATESIQVVDVKALSTPVPGYEVTLKNLSPKRVDALKVEVHSAGRGRSIALLQGEEGQPLIESGGTYRWVVQLVKGESGPSDYSDSDSPDMNSLLLETAVFDDGSYDGRVETACEFAGFQLGRKAWLKQMVLLLNQQIEKDNTTLGSVQEFSEKFEALTYNPFQTQISNSLNSICPRISSLSQIGYKGRKLEFLRDLRLFTTTRPAHAPTFQQWLEIHHTRYRNWLKRLALGG